MNLVYGDILVSICYYPFETQHSYCFRIDPIPGRGCKRRRRVNRYFRHPKTLNEKRAFYGNEEFSRLKRSPVNLPDTYDGLYNASYRNKKSWKRTKKQKQWM